MVTSKRKTTQDTETYQSTVSSSAGRQSSVTFNDELMMMRSYVEPSVEPAPSEPVYKTATQEPAKESRVIIEKKPVRVSDIMPVISSRRAAKVETEKDNETTVVSRDRIISRSMKKALIAYLSVVVVLTIAVIITGVAINSVSAQIDDYDAVANSLTQTIALQQSELDRLSDPEEIGRMAGNLNMVAVNGAHSGELVPVKNAQTNNNTNWFNDFCNWIASIFGG